MENKKIITRFAPSPTGELHIGGARTALFNYLLAKSLGGEFLLRIEDTDRERFVPGATERIVESLHWLGISPDNKDNVMIQSERLQVYKKAAFDLVEAGNAYVCTCTREKLAESRQKQIKEGKSPKYEGFCRDTKANLADLKEGCYTIRMKMPQSGSIIVNDLIRGDVTFDLSLFDDQIILKSDGYPTYHLAHVIDDYEMGITHVLRAEEWLPSTPKHLILYQMLGYKAPKFAHLSMILAPDKTKLSKRHGAVSVIEYQKEGYLSDAIVNFIALLGWNPKDEREIFLLEELVNEFKLKNVNKSPAVFNIEKLNSINEHYIRQYLASNRLCIKTMLEHFGLDMVKEGELDLLSRGGFKTIKEAAEYFLALRKSSDYQSSLLVFKKSTKEKTETGLDSALSVLKDLGESNWMLENLQKALVSIVESKNLTNGDVFWPVRVALSGQEKSPSPTELMVALGKEESLNRINTAIRKLK